MDLETSHEQLGDIITFWIKKGILPIVLGGSHDLSFGSVSGLIQAIPGQEKIGLINIDSHLDIDVCARAYTPGASASQADGLTASEILQISFLAGKEKKVKLFEVRGGIFRRKIYATKQDYAHKASYANGPDYPLGQCLLFC